MAMKRSRPEGGDSKVGSVGPSYPDSHFRNPFNVGIDSVYGDESEGRSSEFTQPRYGAGTSKTLLSPTSTVVGMHVVDVNGLNDYDSNWEHGTRATDRKPKGPRESQRWTPRGGHKGE